MIEIAFLGAAHIHVPGFSRMLSERTDVRVKTVWDADVNRSTPWAKQLGATVAESAATVLADPAIGGVVICSETHRHEELVRLTAAAKKHVFVEKPLGMAAKDAWAMADVIEAAGVLFQTGYFQRSDPTRRFIKSLIEAGSLGKITKVWASNAHPGALGDWFKARPDAISEDWNWMTKPAVSGVGAFGDLGTHALDILLWWLGDVEKATAQIDTVTNTYGCDESGQGLIRFKSGVTAALSAGWVDPADPVQYLVSGTEGHAAIIKGQLFVTSKKQPTFDGTAAVRTSELSPAAPHAFELFLDAIVGKPLAVPLVTAREAAYRSAVMDAMYAGAKNDTWVKPAVK